MGVAEVADKIINNHHNHHMRIEESLCSRFRTPKSGCSQCADICPVGAISISDKGVEITGECTDCGVCLSVCPNSVFMMKEGDNEKIIDEIRSKVKGQGSEILNISCQRGDSRADLIVPCLGRLTEAMLIEPIKVGISTIEILQPECVGCPNSKVSLHIERVINRVLTLYEMVGRGKGTLTIKRIPLQPLSKKPEKSVSRRDFLFSFRTKAVEVAAASLPEVGTEGDEKETFIEVINKRHEGLKRRLLMEALKGFPSSKEVHMQSADAMLAEIVVFSKCTACGVCTTLCPTGALTQRWEDEHFYLSFNPSLCTNCRVCIETCMAKAMGIKKTARLNYLLEDTEIKVFEAKRKTCSVCRIDFISTGSGIIGEAESPQCTDICPH